MSEGLSYFYKLYYYYYSDYIGIHKDCGLRYRKDCGLCVRIPAKTAAFVQKRFFYFYNLYCCSYWFYAKHLELQFLYEMCYINKVLLLWIDSQISEMNHLSIVIYAYILIFALYVAVCVAILIKKIMGKWHDTYFCVWLHYFILNYFNKFRIQHVSSYFINVFSVNTFLIIKIIYIIECFGISIPQNVLWLNFITAISLYFIQNKYACLLFTKIAFVTF